MKRKNIAVKRKADKKKLLIKNNKIKRLYKRFKLITFKSVKKNNFAVAVSGGSDSLCLAYLCKLYSLEFKNKIHVIIVDHGLRKESKEEAIEVKNILKRQKIKSIIANWKGKPPISNIQKNARDIRYFLISNYCSKKNIKYLLTAHHMDDQIENFFIRLLRGSGLKGLSSMSENVSYSDNLKIVRPFLEFKKNDLKYVTLSAFKTFISDPSNYNEKFLRVRIRKFKKNLEEEGLDMRNIIRTVNNLNSASKSLNYYKNKALQKYVSFLSKNKCLINKQIFKDEAWEIIFYSFSDILSLVSGTYYPPRSKKIVNLIRRIGKNNFYKSTLGGCVIEKKDDFVLITKETKIGKTRFQPTK